MRTIVKRKQWRNRDMVFLIIILSIMWIVGINTCIAAYKSQTPFPNRLKIRNRYNEKER